MCVCRLLKVAQTGHAHIYCRQRLSGVQSGHIAEPNMRISVFWTVCEV